MSEEAYTREAVMIDAIGLHNIANINNGSKYGDVKTWDETRSSKYGSYLLYSAMKIHLAEGEHQIRKHQVAEPYVKPSDHNVN